MTNEQQTKKGIDVDELEDRVLVNISNALYNSDADVITLQGQRFPVQKHAKGMKYVDLGDWTIMQQNRWKGTQYAQMIAKGHEITWCIPKNTDRNWIRIMDGEVKR